MFKESQKNEMLNAGLEFYSHCKAIQDGFCKYYCRRESKMFHDLLTGTTPLILDPPDKEIDDRIFECDVLLDSTWETINIGHWRNVDIFWRQLYRAVCFIKSVNLTCAGKYSDAILSCDMGLIMGAPLSDELFVQELADILCELVSTDLKEVSVSDPEEKADIPLPLLPNLHNVPCVNAPTLEKYLELLRPGTPFIMKNVVNHWPAMKKWSPLYLFRHFGERTIPVEIGSSYTSDLWSQKLVKLKEFITTYILSQSDEVAYLAQYELFNHITKLKDDIIPLDYLAISDSEVVTNCWFGPVGTVSPLHHDHYENLFCQVYGYKRFVMFSRHDNMHPHQHHLLENTSQVDIESPSVNDDFPDYKDKTAWVADLGPGDVLYVPLHWWHHVRSLSVSLSVSMWWKN
ncbi:hypothetical protein ACHWQZ_G006360 [Mnemiopsis leidyi]